MAGAGWRTDEMVAPSERRVTVRESRVGNINADPGALAAWQILSQNHRWRAVWAAAIALNGARRSRRVDFGQLTDGIVA